MANEKHNQVSQMLEDGIKSVFSSERYINYLKFTEKFHSYSFRNIMLIMLQNPNATRVAGFNDWKNKHKRYVKKGEKGLNILAPIPYKVYVEVPVYDNNHNPVFVDGKQLTEQKTIQKLKFKVVSVFDVSQTDGEPLPSLAPELTAKIENYPDLFSAISNFSDYTIDFIDIPGAAHGYCDFLNKEIKIDNGMSEAQNIKTLIHEVAHSRLHEPNIDDEPISRREKEIQAESIAFIVANHFGIDTSDYSFEYIAGWSSDKELTELSKSLDIIQKEANIMIQGIEEQYKVLLKNRNIEINNAEKGVDRDMDGIDDSRDSSYTTKVSEPDKDIEQAQELKHTDNATLESIYNLVAEHKEQIANSPNERNTVVINAFAGPGAGKTTSCLEVCEKLKKAGYVAEYVQEYAKELVWDNNLDLLNGSMENQFTILQEQLKRVDRLYGKVDFIVTDSPILLNTEYLKDTSPEYSSAVQNLYGQFNNFNYFVERNVSAFETEGRIHNLEQSLKIDNNLKNTLQAMNIEFGTYTHSTIDNVVQNAIDYKQNFLQDMKAELLKINTEISETQKALDEAKDFGEFVNGWDVDVYVGNKKVIQEFSNELEQLLSKKEMLENAIYIAENNKNNEAMENGFIASDTTLEKLQTEVLEEIKSQSPKAQQQQRYSKEENERIVADIKSSIPIQDYAQRIGFTVQRAGSYYTLKEHDSVRIDPRKNRFVQNSTGVKGSIIDFVMHFENLDKAAAIDKLAKYIGSDTRLSPTPIQQQSKTADIKPTQLVLPEKAKTMRNIFAYLINTRKIDSKIVSQWVTNGNLYQDTHNNCVFVTYNKDGKPEFASQRGTNTSHKFRADIAGSNYDICHFINNNANTLVIGEAVIDVMSVQTILKANGRDINKYNYLSLNGTTKTHAVINALQNSNTNTVVLATDNDNAGKEARNTLRAMISDFNKDIKVIDYVPQNEKDWNAELVANVQLEEQKQQQQDSKSSLSAKISNCQQKADNLNKALDKVPQQKNEHNLGGNL